MMRRTSRRRRARRGRKTARGGWTRRLGELLFAALIGAGLAGWFGPRASDYVSLLVGGEEQAPPATVSPDRVLIDMVTRIRDGDTIVVGLVPIRIANLDCAEKGTAEGDRATARIQELVTGAQMRCTLEGRRSWDREVGVCDLPDGRDVGEVLIAEGYCAQWR